MTVIDPATLPTDDVGDNVSGTKINRSFFSTLKTAIDNLIHSPANPTVDPNDITDEVVAARGSKASVDARLDIALNEDGTLKAFPATSPITQSGVAGEAITAGDLCYVVTSGLGDPGTLSRWYKCSAATDYKSDKARLFGFAVNTLAAGNTGVFTVIGEYTLLASNPLFGILTPGNVYYMSNTAGQISATAGTKRAIVGFAKTSNILELYPTLNTVAASVVNSGLITIDAQTLDGIKTFKRTPLISFYGVNAPASQVIYESHTPVGNVGAGEDTLMSVSGVGISSASAGLLLRVTAWGYFAANATAKQVKLKLTDTVPNTAILVASTSSADYNNLAWKVVAEILFLAVTQEALAEWKCSGAATATLRSIMTRSNISIDFIIGGASIYCTGEAAANNDIVQVGMIVEALNGI